MRKKGNQEHLRRTCRTGGPAGLRATRAALQRGSRKRLASVYLAGIPAPPLPRRRPPCRRHLVGRLAAASPSPTLRPAKPPRLHPSQRRALRAPLPYGQDTRPPLRGEKAFPKLLRSLRKAPGLRAGNAALAALAPCFLQAAAQLEESPAHRRSAARTRKISAIAIAIATEFKPRIRELSASSGLYFLSGCSRGAAAKTRHTSTDPPPESRLDRATPGATPNANSQRQNGSAHTQRNVADPQRNLGPPRKRPRKTRSQAAQLHKTSA